MAFRNRHTLIRFILFLMAGLFFFVGSVRAEVLPTVAPEEVGLSSERLRKIDELMNTDIQSSKLAGSVVLIARQGKIAYFKSFGLRHKTESAPMQDDAIFRIYSMTKPFTSVAAMILFEEGKFALSDPISKYLPEYRRMTVGTEEDGEVKTSPAKRPITVHDLLRHTSGFTYGVFGQSGIKTMYLKAGIYSNNQTLEQMSQNLAKIPLIAEPGTLWEYSRSTDILGRLVEVISGLTLDEFLKQRIFIPLKMPDSGFYVEEANWNRIAEPASSKTRVIQIRNQPVMLSGGGRGVSTAMDYLRFCQMMLNGGELDNVRLLSPKTVEYMTSDHLGKMADRTDGWYLPGPGYGFGLGFAVRTATGLSAWPGSVGDYYWGGWAGTYFWVDPVEELIAIYMMQDPARRDHYRRLIRSLVYQAVID